MLVLLIERTYLRPAPFIALDELPKKESGPEMNGREFINRAEKSDMPTRAFFARVTRIISQEESELDLLVLGSVQRVKTVINSYTTKNFIFKYFDFHDDIQKQLHGDQGRGCGQKTDSRHHLRGTDPDRTYTPHRTALSFPEYQARADPSRAGTRAKNTAFPSSTRLL